MAHLFDEHTIEIGYIDVDDVYRMQQIRKYFFMIDGKVALDCDYVIRGDKETLNVKNELKAQDLLHYLGFNKYLMHGFKELYKSSQENGIVHRTKYPGYVKINKFTLSKKQVAEYIEMGKIETIDEMTK